MTIKNNGLNKLFNKFSLKTLKLATLQKLKSNLFHSITVDEKKQFLNMFGIIIQFFVGTRLKR